MQVPEKFKRATADESMEAVLRSLTQLEKKLTLIGQENKELRDQVEELEERAEFAESTVAAVAANEIRHRESAAMLAAAVQRNGVFH